MAESTLLNPELVTDGKRLIDDLDAAGVPITQAFWNYSSHWLEPRLHLVVPTLPVTGPRPVLEKAGELLRRSDQPTFDLTAIRLLPNPDRDMQNALNFFTRRPGLLGKSGWYTSVNDDELQPFYVYALLVPTPA